MNIPLLNVYLKTDVVEFDVHPVDLEIESDDFTFCGMIHVTCKTVKNGHITTVNGVVTAEAELQCSRCLVSLNHSFREKYSLVVHHLHQGQSKKDIYQEDEDASDDSLLVVGHDVNSVDITEYVRDALLLSHLWKPLCAESCKGLCAACGQNLNEGACVCSSTSSDPRWSGLNGLSDI